VADKEDGTSRPVMEEKVAHSLEVPRACHETNAIDILRETTAMGGGVFSQERMRVRTQLHNTRFTAWIVSLPGKKLPGSSPLVHGGSLVMIEFGEHEA